MFTVRKHLQRFVGLALTAMLALALLPTVAHALSFAQGGKGALAEICTPQGAQWVVVEGSAPGNELPMTGIHHLEDCPYCGQGASALGMPPALPTAWAANSGADVPPLFLHAPRTQFAWIAAQPRGPPSLS
jgi:hypothetical protein